MQDEYGYTLATESELNDLLVGKQAGIAVRWPAYSLTRPVPAGSTGVIWKKSPSSSDLLRPLAIVAREEDFRRLFGRFAQLRSDLSPLSAWCHLLTPPQFELLETAVREPDLGDLEAAWIGLIIAEAQLLSENSLRSLRFPACLATQSFAIARSSALWGYVSENDIGKRFDVANRFFRITNGVQPWERRTTKVRSALEPIWTILSGLLRGQTQVRDRELQPVMTSLMELQAARRRKDPNEAERFARPLMNSVPEALALVHLADLAPEQRLKVFDEIIHNLNALKEDNASLRHSALALLAGYLATVAAGGTPTLSLAESNASLWPEITAWAYVVGGIGERVVWTSGFDGLGRLVARELTRSLRVDEPPTCDFALDEALVLVDPKLPDPLVHLRIKNGKLATVALFPGVNVSISGNDLPIQESTPQRTQTARPVDTMRPSRNPAALIADAIWPYLRARVEECVISTQENDVYSTSSRQRHNTRRSPSQMPLKGSKK